MKLFNLILALSMGLGILVMPMIVQAQTNTATSSYIPSGKVEGDKGGLVQCGNKTDDPCTVEDIFNIFIIGTNLLIGMVGLIAIYSIVGAGFSMVTAAGNTEGITKGKKQLTNAIIGMILVLLAFFLVNILVNGIIGARDGGNILSNPLQYIGGAGSPNQSNTNNTSAPTNK